MEVAAVLGPSVYAMREFATGRTFERTVANITAYRADPEQAPTSLSKGDKSSFQVGNFVTTIDSEDSKEVWLAQVTALSEEGYDVHYWATCGSKWATAVFKPAYVGSSTGRTHLTHSTASIKEPYSPWTGQIESTLALGKIDFSINAKGQHKVSAEVRGKLTRYVLAHL